MLAAARGIGCAGREGGGEGRTRVTGGGEAAAGGPGTPRRNPGDGAERRGLKAARCIKRGENRNPKIPTNPETLGAWEKAPQMRRVQRLERPRHPEAGEAGALARVRVRSRRAAAGKGRSRRQSPGRALGRRRRRREARRGLAASTPPGRAHKAGGVVRGRPAAERVSSRRPPAQPPRPPPAAGDPLVGASGSNSVHLAPSFPFRPRLAESSTYRRLPAVPTWKVLVGLPPLIGGCQKSLPAPHPAGFHGTLKTASTT
nr:uncharacterized protein LOC121828230 [Peromyscus maniculatus bairdii]